MYVISLQMGNFMVTAFDGETPSIFSARCCILGWGTEHKLSSDVGDANGAQEFNNESSWKFYGVIT